MTKTDSEIKVQAEFLDPVEALDRLFVLPEETTQVVAADLVAEAQTLAQNSIQTRMNFRVGDVELLCPDNASREVVDSPSVNRLPNTAPWFKGLANVHGGMTPVVDLGQALGNKQRTKKHPYLMIFGRGNDAIGLLIDDIPRIVTLSMTGKLTNPPSISRLLDGCVIAAYDIDNKIRFDLDINNLFQSLSANLR